MICLHGHGHTAQRGLQLCRHISGHIIVAPQGLERSWNIVHEASTANDVGFVGTSLVNYLAQFSNVNPTGFKIFGFSNGAGLANRIAIENDDARITHIITSSSQLNTFQYHNGSFWIGSGPQFRDYSKISKGKVKKRRLLQCTGNIDHTVGCCGNNPRGPGGVVFLNWKESAYQYARAWGYNGGRLSPGQDKDTYSVSYLGGQVQAFNYKNYGHGTPCWQKAIPFIGGGGGKDVGHFR